MKINLESSEREKNKTTDKAWENNPPENVFHKEVKETFGGEFVNKS